MSLHTLRAMASGGINDQIGGGFARYSVDATWTVPHFEKMLYDNALLARAYLHGWQVSGDELLLRTARETLDFCLRELRGPEGGFHAALDADSEGVEGRFYVWSLDELRDVLGDLADEAIAYFGASDAGNFEGANILEARGPEPDPATRARIRELLLDRRARRVRPGLDDKRLTSWNALMISALAEAGAVLEEPRYLDAAVACADFVLDRAPRLTPDTSCGPSTPARPASAPTSRTTPSCSRPSSPSTRRASTSATSSRPAPSPTRSSTASPTPSAAASSRPRPTTKP